MQPLPTQNHTATLWKILLSLNPNALTLWANTNIELRSQLVTFAQSTPYAADVLAVMLNATADQYIQLYPQRGTTSPENTS